MPKLNWNSNDFRNPQDSSGTVADTISRNGNLQQGYEHGSLTRGLVAYYPMEKGEGEVLHDGALDNDAYLRGARWLQDSNIGEYSLNFEGNGDTATIDPFLNGDEDEMTISVWVKIDGSWTGNWEPVVFDVGGYSMRLRTDDGSRRSDGNRGFGFHVSDGSSWSWDASIPTSSLSTGQWYNIIGIYRKGEVEFYVNGNLEGTDTSGTLNMTSNTGSLMGEYDNNRRYKDGKISDFRIYRRALSKPEIKSLANLSQPSGVERLEKTVPGQSEGRISRYKLNGDTDDFWGTNNGTNSGVTFETGVYDQAGVFDGTSYIDPDTQFGLDSAGQASFACG